MPPTMPPARPRQKGLPVAGAGVAPGMAPGVWVGVCWRLMVPEPGDEGWVEGREGVENERLPRLPEEPPEPARAKAVDSSAIVAAKASAKMTAAVANHLVRIVCFLSFGVWGPRAGSLVSGEKRGIFPQHVPECALSGNKVRHVPALRKPRLDLRLDRRFCD